MQLGYISPVLGGNYTFFLGEKIRWASPNLGKTCGPESHDIYLLIDSLRNPNSPQKPIKTECFSAQIEE